MITNTFARATRAVSLAAVLACPAAALAHNSPGYSHDSGPGGNYSNPSWMGKLSDAKRISQLSIPGTHDSLSFHGGDAVKTQSMSLAKQLESGIRAFDIRCRHFKDAFTIHHGPVYQKANFTDVLVVVDAFLAANPRETVLLRVKPEHTAEGNTRTFEETFATYVAKYPNRFWTPGGTNPSNPTLGEVRGKIVVLQNFTANKDWGLKWSSFTIQDDYNFSTNWDLEKKWNKIWDHAQATGANKGAGVHVNFLSGSGGSFPYFVASGHSSPGTGAPRLSTAKTTPGWKNCCKMFPRVDCAIGICTIAFEGTNVLFYQKLENIAIHTGIVMADFPGHGLIKRIIDQN